MNHKNFNIFVAAYLAILIPLPGRFVFGFTLLIEFFLLIIIGTLINSLILKLKLEEIKSFITMFTLISFSVLYRQILIITYPEIALTLGYFVYIPTISLIIINFLFINSKKSLQKRLKENLSKIIFFIFSGLLFTLIRDIAGYGTFTFFGKNHQIYEKILFNSNIGIFSFISSISGALIFAGICIFVQLIVKNKMRILKNAEVNDDLR